MDADADLAVAPVQPWDALICTSQAYQRSTQPTPTNANDVKNFARGPIRRIRAETMLDLITQVTDTKNKFQGLPQGSRAVQIAGLSLWLRAQRSWQVQGVRAQDRHRGDSG